ncbi:MAG TPA: LAGLIDADG family homing endonuclease [Nitrososphaerales archaeon]|nr:LAGLIDADG family homing endonuclease [Nitrososphaerales archaeon]
MSRLDTKFAYFLGLLLGDGYVGDLRVSLLYLVGHLVDERDFYDRLVVPLVSELFGLRAHAYVRRGQQAYALQIHSINLIEYLRSKIGFSIRGMSKVVPKVVLASSAAIKKAFLAGLFDADGCLVFAKSHGSYRYPRIEIKSVDKSIIETVCKMLRDLGFRATIRKSAESWVASVNGEAQLEKWMSHIGSHNIKHLSKYLLWKESGFCPPHTSMPERLHMLHLNPDNFYHALVGRTGIDVNSF